MKKGILIVGEENGLEMQVLEQQLASRLKRCSYPMSREQFWTGGDMPGVLCFRLRGMERKIATDWIVYLEKEMRKIHLHLEQKKTMVFYSGMEEVRSQLGPQFCYCHKSFIVNMDKAEKIEENNFIMKDGSVVPIGQRRMGIVRDQFERYRDQKNLENLRFFENFSCFEI